MVNEKRMLGTFYDLVRIYAPSGGEREVCEYLKKKLRELGASRITEDHAGEKTGSACGNLIAFFNETMPGLPSVAFTAHMDCVETCRDIQPVLENGVIRSSGDTILGGDDKAGVAAILEGLALMKEGFLPHGKITVIFTVQEESGLGGSSHIDEELLRGIDFGYVLDCDGAPGTAIIQGPGQYKITCTMHGRAAHAGVAPEKGINAIAMMAKALSSMKLGRIDEETTCNVGCISGGKATNIVPDTCTAYAEARSLNHDKLMQIVKEMEMSFQNAEKKFPGGRAEIESREMYRSFSIAEDHPAVKLFKSAAGAAGFPVSVGPSGGGSDANWFSVKGFPALLLGVGMTDFHTSEESLKEQDLYHSGELVYRMIEALPHFQQHHSI